MGRKLNTEQKRARLAGEPRMFVWHVRLDSTRAKPRRTSNRMTGYDRAVEKRIKRMKPEEMARPLRDASDG